MEEAATFDFQHPWAQVIGNNVDIHLIQEFIGGTVAGLILNIQNVHWLAIVPAIYDVPNSDGYLLDSMGGVTTVAFADLPQHLQQYEAARQVSFRENVPQVHVLNSP